VFLFLDLFAFSKKLAANREGSIYSANAGQYQ
jgi:hypothetical protein